MGAYIYTLRKKSKVCDIMGITPVNVIAMEYAYKPSHFWDTNRSYKAMVGRYEAQAVRAAEHFMREAQIENGTTDNSYYIVFGGFEEGAPVFKTKPGHLPDVVIDDSFGQRGEVEMIGTLYKVGRRWTIEKECPGHKWETEGMAMGDWRTAYKDRSTNPNYLLPARKCKRCGQFELLDPKLRAEYAEYQEAKRLQYAA